MNRIQVVVVCELTLRICLGLVFVYSGLMKINSYFDLADNIHAYHMLSNDLINLVAIGLPPLEIVCGLCLLTGILVRIAVLTIGIMLSAFAMALANAMIHGITLTCGCFGGTSWLDANPLEAFVRDLILMFLVAYLYYLHFIRDQKDIRGKPIHE